MNPPPAQPFQHQQNLYLAGQRLAVIDVGSNGIRLLAVELQNEHAWSVLAEERATARLAEGQSRQKELCPQSMARAVDAIGRFKARCDNLGCTVHAFATAAVREATNREDFLALVKDRTGLDVATITAQEEGKFTYAAVAQRFDLSHGHHAVVDIGGGSVEVVFSRDGVIMQNSSMPLGAVRLTEAFGSGREDHRSLRRHIDRTLEQSVAAPESIPGMLVGCGGTFTTLLTLSAAARGVLLERSSPALRTLGPISRSQVREVLDRLRAMPLADRLRVPGLPPDRADIVVAGLTVVERLMKHLGVSVVHANPGGVREGVLARKVRDRAMEQEGPGSHEERLVASARNLAERCHYDRAHSEHVAALAAKMYDSMKRKGMIPRLDTERHERAVLESAAILHDVGMLVSYKQHHKHSATIVRHADLAGWDTRFQEVLALLCRYHRRKGPSERHASYAALPETDRSLVSRLAAILRVADGLDRSHAQCVTDVGARTQDGSIMLEVDSEGGTDAEVAAAHSKSDVLASVTGKRVQVVPRAMQRSHTHPDAGEVVVRRPARGAGTPNGHA